MYRITIVGVRENSCTVDQGTDLKRALYDRKHPCIIDLQGRVTYHCATDILVLYVPQRLIDVAQYFMFKYGVLNLEPCIVRT